MRKEELPGKRAGTTATEKQPGAATDVVHEIDIAFARFRQMREAVRKQVGTRRRMLMTGPSN